MAEETISMTQKAIDRLAIIQQVAAKQLRHQEATRQLGLSVRQVKRLVARPVRCRPAPRFPLRELYFVADSAPLTCGCASLRSLWLV